MHYESRIITKKISKSNNQKYNNQNLLKGIILRQYFSKERDIVFICQDYSNK